MSVGSGTTQLPWLFRGAQHVRSPAIIRHEAVVRFGELAHLSSDQMLHVLLDAEACAPLSDQKALAEWRRAVAEELLLLSVLGYAVHPALIRRWGKLRPLDTCELPLERLASRRAAVAMIPLATTTCAPECAHLWLIEGSETAAEGRRVWRALPSSVTIRGCSFAVHTVMSHPAPTLVDGSSFQLALALLERALAYDDKRAVSALALDWIISGAVQGEQITRIDLGNKSDLHTRRRWLIPKTNEPDVLSHASGADLFDYECARTVDDAFNLITNAGPINEGRIHWPRDISALHSFISGAHPPVIACALLSLPCHIVLWYSGPTWEAHAKTLREVLKHFLPSAEITLRQISSSDLCQAEKTLKEAVSAKGPEESVTLFNITQGNRLMSFAALEVAKRNPRLWLVYRDVDAPPFTFTMIRYERDAQPHTYTLVGVPHAGLRIRWDVLFRPAEKAQIMESPEARARAIVQELSESSTNERSNGV